MSRYVNIPIGPCFTDLSLDIDETNASAAIRITGRSFVNASNDLYGSIQTIRYNRSRFIRVANYVPGTLSFMVQGITGGLATIGVVVNNALFATIAITTTDAAPRWYSVTGMTVGAKTVELYEEFQDRTSNLNTGTDGKASACYVVKVALPNGSGGPIAKVTAPNAIAAFGDSHIDGTPGNPISVNGWGGQLRRACHAAGNWTLGYVGAGSSTQNGDGPTAADQAQMIHDLWAACGATAKKLLIFRRPNDYAYYGTGISTTPAVYGTWMQSIFTALDSSDPGWTGICSRIPQGTSWAANPGGFTLDNYWTQTVTASTASGRTNVQTFDKTSFPALSLATDYVEADPGQVHLAQAGGDKVFAVVRTWYGL